MMHMTFYWGTRVTILFDSWKTDSWLSYVLSLLACFVLAVLLQFMEDRRIRLRVHLRLNPSVPIPGTTPLLHSSRKWGRGFAAATLFGINSAIGYLLMLAVMTFNAGVFVAVVVGLGLGYFIFRLGDEEVMLLDDNENPCACA